MKKIISDNVIKFPFDNAISVKVNGSQMNQQQKDVLYNLFELDLELSEYQEGINDISNGKFLRKYYPSEVFFKNQYEKEKESTPDLNEKAFAKSEKLRIEGILEQVEKLMNKSEYSRNDTYKRASNYIEHLNTVINSQIRTRQPEKHYNSLDELFKNPADIDPCIKALNKVDPPIIDETGRYIARRLKGAFVIWIDVLRSKGKVYDINDMLLPELLSKKFPGLTISDSLFRQENFRASDKYKLDFKVLIS